MTAKTPAPVDKTVGQRVRMRRLMLGMSQSKLAEAIGITFQQVQKYEKGANRIGASRLAQIAKILECSISFFFAENEPVPAQDIATEKDIQVVSAILATKDGVTLVKSFANIKSDAVRKNIVRLALACADC